MAVLFMENLVPIEEDPTLFFPEFDANEHRFTNATMAMARDVIHNDIAPAAAAAGIQITEKNDPRLVLDLMQWWNDLTTTCVAMPVFRLDKATESRIAHLQRLCHICHNELTASRCCTVCTAMERDESVATIVHRDLKRLDTILFYHRNLCRHSNHRLSVLGTLKTTLELGSSRAWSVPMNSILARHLGWTFLGWQCKHVRHEILNPIKLATQQMKAYYALSTMTPPTGQNGRPILVRLQQLDDDAAATTIYTPDKLEIQRTLHEYLNHVEAVPPCLRGSTLEWIPQPHLLHQALRALETVEQDMQSTRLALVVRALFQEHDPEHADHAMDIIAQRVNDFLGATEDDTAYLSEWLS